MTQPTVSEASDHLRLTHDADLMQVQLYIEAARAELARYIGAELPDPLPADLCLAVLEMVHHAYDHRADPDAKPGLTPAAARIAARYRRVTL